jgi:nitrogen fixation NifU-like protein
MLAEADRATLIEELAQAAVGKGLRGEGPEAHRRSPACGDDVTVRVVFDGGTLVGVTWDGHGCVVSMAAASALSSAAVGATVDGFRKLANRYLVTIEADATPDTDLGDLEAFAGIGRYPLRAGCASLAWRAALGALA